MHFQTIEKNKANQLVDFNQSHTTNLRDIRQSLDGQNMQIALDNELLSVEPSSPQRNNFASIRKQVTRRMDKLQKKSSFIANNIVNKLQGLEEEMDDFISLISDSDQEEDAVFNSRTLNMP